MTELSKNTQVPQCDKTTVSKSVLISDKCKLDFEKWLDRQNVAPYKVMFYDIPIVVQIAYLVEWFDVVGLNIYTKPRFHYGGLSFDGFIDGMEISKIETEYFKTRNEAFLKAIELANVFYNDNFV
jgi:hypothetical protein